MSKHRIVQLLRDGVICMDDWLMDNPPDREWELEVAIVVDAALARRVDMLSPFH